MKRFRLYSKYLAALTKRSRQDVILPTNDYTVDNREQASLIGYVDNISPNCIRGWVAHNAYRDEIVQLSVFLDEKLVWQGPANKHREDLVSVGIGKGSHGFECYVPTRSLVAATVLKLIARVRGEDFLFLSDNIIGDRPRLKGRTVHIDVSDLLVFFSNYREISGIQRVQVGYINGLMACDNTQISYSFCCRLPGTLSYVFVDNHLLRNLISESDEREIIKDAFWKEHVRLFCEKIKSRVVFSPEDVLLTLGAPWATDFHNEIVRYVKKRFCIYYFQVFYDIIPLNAPEFVASGLVPPFSSSMSALITHADHIFSISQFSANELRDACVRLNRVCPPISIVQMGGTIQHSDTSSVQAKSIVSDRIPSHIKSFVLCVGTLEPRKNHILLYDLWKRLLQQNDPQEVPYLILVGRFGWHMEDLRRIFESSGYLDGKIIHLENVSNPELDNLYLNCLFTIFPSKYEGWGLPISESFQHGKVCVCSNVTSMPEAGGPWAIYIDPFSLTSSYEIVRSLIFDDVSLVTREAELRSGFRPSAWDDAASHFHHQISQAVAQAEVPVDSTQRSAKAKLVTGFTYKLRLVAPGKLAYTTFLNSLIQEESAGILEGDMWFEPDRTCTWSCGGQAKLCLELSGKTEINLVTYVKIRVTSEYVGRSLIICVDGNVVGTLIAQEKMQLLVELNRHLSCSSDDLRVHHLVLKFDSPIVTVSDRIDQRFVAIGLQSIHVCENNPVSRMRYLEDDSSISSLVDLTLPW